MKKKLVSLICAFMLLAGCMPDLMLPDENPFPASSAPAEQPAQPAADNSAEQALEELRLPYNANDSLNPYKMTTERNRLLVPLFYDSLTRPGQSRNPENQLAAEVAMSGGNCVITWREDARFSDGSYLRGEDIVYSFQTAMGVDSPWRSTLLNVAGLTIRQEERQVVAQLFHPDIDFPLLLSFPIIKDGTADAEYPVGISKFYVTGAHNTGVILSRNPIYYGKQGRVETVRLIHAIDSDMLQFGMSSGEFDMLFTDLSNNTLAGVSAPSKSVPLNNLVYIGINGDRGLLRQPEFRHALSMALNRAEIALTAYAGRARAAMYPFHPDFYRLENIDVSAPRNLTAADALLDGLGLTEKDGNGYRLQNGQPVTLRLLVNSENSYRNSAATLISEQLAQAGIRTEVVSGPFSQYESVLKSSQFDLYIGETRLMDNMDFTPLLSGGSLGFSTAYSEELEQRLSQYRETGEIGPLCDMFLAQSPFLPLVFREGLLYTGRDLGAEVVPTQEDLFYNILDW